MSATDLPRAEVDPTIALDPERIAHLSTAFADQRGRTVSVRYHHTGGDARAFRPARPLTYPDARLWA